MAETNGSNVVLMVSPSGVHTALAFVPGQRELTLPARRSEIDVSNKDAVSQQTLAGRFTQEVTILCSRFNDRSDAAGNLLRLVIETNFLSGIATSIGWLDDAVVGTPPVAADVKEYAYATVLEYRENAPDQDGATWFARFKLNEAWNAGPP